MGRVIRPEFDNERNPRHSCRLSEVVKMVKQKYVYWKDDDMWLGYLEEFPDYWTQGETEEELKENLIDLYKELSSGTIPNVLRVAELEIA
jgi:predicted RNase H-like HicB family nuclease